MEDAEFQAVFAKVSEDGLCAGPVVFDGNNFAVSGDVPLTSIKEIRSGKERKKVLLFDAESLSRKKFNPSFVEKVRISGSDIWLIETVKDLADIADGFLANIFRLVVPVRTVDSFGVLLDAIEVSDDCVPLIEIAKRKAAGEETDPYRLTERLSSAGFVNIVVMDLDGSLGGNDWQALRNKCPGLIPYVPLTGKGTVANVFGFTVSR